MRIDEQQSFDNELNTLLTKYRIAVIGGIYLSELGPGEQVGIFGGCNTKVPRHIIDLGKLTKEQHKIFAELDL